MHAQFRRRSHMYKHILLPFDGSELSVKAVREGIALAKAFGSKVTLITATAPYHVGLTSPITASFVHEIEKRHRDESEKEAHKLHDEILERAKLDGIEC